MKNIFRIFPLCAIISLLCGCSGQSKGSSGSNSGYSTYKCEQYEISYPQEWQLVQLPQEEGDFYCGSSSKKIGFSVMRTENIWISLDEVIRRTDDGFKRMGWTVEHETTEILQSPADKALVVGNDGIGETKSYVYNFFVRDVLYTIRFGEDPALFDKNIVLFDYIISTLKIPDWPPLITSKVGDFQMGGSVADLERALANKALRFRKENAFLGTCYELTNYRFANIIWDEVEIETNDESVMAVGFTLYGEDLTDVHERLLRNLNQKYPTHYIGLVGCISCRAFVDDMGSEVNLVLFGNANKMILYYTYAGMIGREFERSVSDL